MSITCVLCSAVPDGALVSSLQQYVLIRISVYSSLKALALMDQQGQKEAIHFGTINLNTVRQFVNSINISWAAPRRLLGQNMIMYAVYM